MSLQKIHLNFISARSSEEPILLGKIQGACQFTWVNTRNPPFYLEKHKEPTEPTMLLGKTQGAHGAHHVTWKNRSPPFFHGKTQGAHQEPTILLGKTQGTHQEPTIYMEKHKEPTILLGKTQGAQPFTHWAI